MESLLRGYRREIGLVLIFGIGESMLTLQVFHAISEGENLQAILFGIFFPALFNIGLVVGGIWLWLEQRNDRFVLRTAMWAAVGGAAFVVAATLTILYQQAEGVVVSDQVYMLVNATSAGSLVGFVIGVYDSRQRVSRTRAEHLNDRLTVLNRVLRHDIRNRANVLKWHAEALKNGASDVAEKATMIQQQSDEIVELGDRANEIEQLLQSEDAAREVLDPVSIAQWTITQVESDYANIDVSLSCGTDRKVYAHPLITTAITNLLENAVEHNDKDVPRIDIETTTVHRTGTDYVELRISDNGPGIPRGEVEVLERGFETDLEHASGIGLWLVYWIVSASDGQIDLTADDGGTEVRLQLEAADPGEESTMSVPATGDDSETVTSVSRVA